MSRAFEKYIKKYGKNYPEGVLEYIVSHYEKDIDDEFRRDFMYQVYGAIGELREDQNYYKEYLKMLERYGFLGLNLLEVGVGCYPLLASYVSEYQRAMKKGSLIGYDPLLVTTHLRRVKLYKKKFTMETKLKRIDAIIAIKPCDATETIIQKANLERKNLFLAFCGCTHFGDEDEWGSYSLWIKSMIEYAKENLDENKEIIIERLDPKFGIDYPILIIVDKKRKDVPILSYSKN